MPQDQEEFAQFYARHIDAVYRFCLIRMRDRADAEDLTQETFLRAMAQPPDLWESQEHARAWLIVTASNLCKNTMRSWIRTRRMEMADWDTMGIAEPAEDPMRRQLLAAVMGLPDPYKTVIYLFYYEGYSGAEIAAMLEKKESTVRSLLHRGRKRLLHLLGGASDDETA